MGFDPVRDRSEITERVGAQLQESRLQDRIRVGEALDLYASFYRNPADRRQLLERFGLGDKVRSKYSDLSGGQKQRLSVALALVGSPEVAILDELTTGLDPQARRSTWDTIERMREGGVTVVLVTHFMDEAERLCDRIMVVNRGRAMAIDTPLGLISSTGVEQTLRFVPSEPLDDEALNALPEVASVAREGTRTVVGGTGNLVQAVTTMMSQRGVIAEDLRVAQTSLEDAYLEMTSGAAEAEQDTAGDRV